MCHHFLRISQADTISDAVAPTELVMDIDRGGKSDREKVPKYFYDVAPCGVAFDTNSLLVR